MVRAGGGRLSLYRFRPLTVVMASRIAHCLLLIASLAWAYPAWGGGAPPLQREDPREEARQERWRRNPAAAMPEMIKEVCQGARSSSTASELLVELGAPAVAPLLAAFGSKRGCGERAPDTVAEALCHAQARMDDGHLTGAFGSMRAAFASPEWDRVRAALLVIGRIGSRPPDTPMSDSRGVRGFTFECQAPAPLLAASAAPLGRLLARTSGPRKEQVTMAVWALGRHATPLAAALVRTLDDADARYEAVTALAGIGPAAAPAAPALGRLLETTENEWRRFSIAYALGQIGPPAAVALAPLRARIAEAATTVCKDGPGAFPWFLRAAVAIGPAPGQAAPAWRAEIIAEVGNALAMLRRCNPYATEASLLDLLAGLPAELGTPLIVQVMMDEGRKMDRRVHAAVVLARAARSLTPAEAATQKLLLGRKHGIGVAGWGWGQQQSEQGGGRRGRADSPARATSLRLGKIIDRCAAEAGRPALANRPTGGHPDDDQEMADCLDGRLCGPEPERGARAMEVCCRYAYGSAGPARCRK
jgi:hypothetical protein